MAYQIITDSCCDYPDTMYAEIDVKEVALSVTFRGETTNHYEEAYLKDLYAGLRAGEVATTAAVNPETWSNAMEEVLKTGEDALVITFSSGLSTTYQSAEIAASELREKYPERKIYVVDSLCASLGQGLFVYYAAKKRTAGMGLEELYSWCLDNRLHLCHWFTVDDLMYLKRGGRVSAATALVGTMLSIKPVLHVDDEGHLINVGKTRGRKSSIQALADKMGQLQIPGENDTVFICHGDCIEDAKYLESLVKERYGVKNVLIYYTGAVIASHSGPGTLALFFIGEHR